MQKQRHNAPGGGQNLGRVGALGVLAAGALCAAVLSVASRVPPTPINAERIPAVEIGSATEGDVTPALREDRRSGPRRRDGKRGSDAGDRRDRGRRARNAGTRGDGVRAGGSAVPVAFRDSRGGAGQNAHGGPPSGGGSDRPVSGTGPGPGSGDDGPGAPGGRGGDGPQPGAGGGGEVAQPRSAPEPAPAPAQPVGGEEAVDDNDTAAPTGTAASEGTGENEVEAETDPAPAAATPAPTLARSGDSDDP
jgi:hypothetical protein